MQFSRHELTILRRAVAHAILRNNTRIKRAKKAAQAARGNPRPGAVSSLAIESTDYTQLWERFKKEIDDNGNPLPPPKGPHECPHCYWGFMTPEILAQHMYDKHNMGHVTP